MVVEFWRELIARMNRMTEAQDALYQRNLHNGLILFHHLSRHFVKGSQVIVNGEWFRYGGLVNRVNIGRTFSGKFVNFKMDIISLLNSSPSNSMANYRIGMFKDAVSLDTLAVRMIDSEGKATFTDRNSSIMDLCVPGAYLRYSGNVSQDNWMGERIFRAEGRVIIDPMGMQQMSPNCWKDSMQSSGLEDASKGVPMNASHLRTIIEFQTDDTAV